MPMSKEDNGHATLPELNITPENRPYQKEKGYVSFREGNHWTRFFKNIRFLHTKLLAQSLCSAMLPERTR